MRKPRICHLILLVTIAILPSGLRADEHFTNDPVSGLDWLNLSATANMAYNDVPTSFPGWRYATNSEIEALFSEWFPAFVPHPRTGDASSFFSPYPGINDEAKGFIEAFGPAYDDGTWLWAVGVYRDENDILRPLGALAYPDYTASQVLGPEYVNLPIVGTDINPRYGIFLVRGGSGEPPDPPSDDIAIKEIRGIQTVQNVETEELVARKDLLVQVEAVNQDPDADTPVAVTVRLCPDWQEANEVCNNDNWLTNEGSFSVYGEDHEFSEDDYVDLKDAANFRIVDENANAWLLPGTRSMKAEVYLGSDTSVEPAATMQSSLTFCETQPLSLKVVKIQARPEIEGYEFKWPDFPASDEKLKDKATELLRVFFPVDEENVTAEVSELRVGRNQRPYRINIGKNFEKVERLFRDITRRVLQEDQRNNESKYQLAVVVIDDGSAQTQPDGEPGDSVYSSNGMALTFEPDPGAPGFVGKFPVVLTVDRAEHSGFVWDMSKVTPHEIGHLFGLDEEYCIDGLGQCPSRLDPPNPAPTDPASGEEPRGNQYGNFILRSQRAYDLRSTTEAIFRREPLQENNFLGYMGSAPTRYAWSGNIEYQYLFNALKTTCSPSSQQRSALAAPAQSRDVLNLIGSILPDGSVELDTPFVNNTGLELSPITGSQYAIDFLDEGVNVLKTVYFDTLQSGEVYGDLIQEEVPLEEPLFIISTELPASTKSLIMSRVSDNERLLELSRSDNPPSVEIRTIETLSNEVIRVGWDSADTDGDSLHYNVYYALDGAYESLVYHALTDAEEKLVDINLVDSNGAGPTEQAYVVVEASDGFNTAEDRVVLNLVGNTDRIVLKQYNTRGPNLPGMCSRKNCVKNKRHTLVASNPDPAVSVVADLRLRLISTPDPACTVNGFLEGDELTVGSSILFNPGKSVRENIELEFICPTTVEPGAMSSFELEAYVWPLGSLDPISSNNSILKSQTVR